MFMYRDVLAYSDCQFYLTCLYFGSLVQEEEKQLAEINLELSSLKEQLSEAKQKGDALVQQV